jgi:hypothetical protein
VQAGRVHQRRRSDGSQPAVPSSTEPSGDTIVAEADAQAGSAATERTTSR